MDDFCVMFERAERPGNNNEWVRIMEDFIEETISLHEQNLLAKILAKIHTMGINKMNREEVKREVLHIVKDFYLQSNGEEK